MVLIERQPDADPCFHPRAPVFLPTPLPMKTRAI
jgi:hypothetical protein